MPLRAIRLVSLPLACGIMGSSEGGFCRSVFSLWLTPGGGQFLSALGGVEERPAILRAGSYSVRFRVHSGRDGREISIVACLFVVDDDRSVVHIFRRCFADSDIEVVSAGTGSEALDAIERLPSGCRHAGHRPSGRVGVGDV